MLAQDIMTRDVATVHPATSLLEAATRMVESRISGLPVVDSDGRLVGMLTEGDLLRRQETGSARQHSGWLDLLLGPARLAADYVQANSRVVGDLMTADPVSVTAETPVADIVALMEKHRVRRLPVLRGGRLAGVVARADLVRVLAQALRGEQDAAPGSDDTIRAAVAAALGNPAWANTHTVTVTVQGGVVTLEGVLFNDAVRPALRVAAENVPGVTRVEDQLTWIEPISGTALGA